MSKKAPYRLETVTCPVLNEYPNLPGAVEGLSQLCKGGKLLDKDGEVVMTKDSDLPWSAETFLDKLEEARKTVAKK